MQMPIRKQTKRSLRMLYLVEQYKKAHQVDEVDTAAVAHWAFVNGLWKRPPMDPEMLLRREISQALRGEHIFDDQGREVRKNHPVKIPQEDGGVLVVWAELHRAKEGHMKLSFGQRRNGVLADCKQMALDYDSYNDNNVFGVKLAPISYNFDPDIEELRFPTDYPDEPPES